MKIDKEQIKWWIEDNKNTFYALCAAVIIGFIALVFVITSLFSKPEETVEVVEEVPNVVEEIEIGALDTDKILEEMQETEEQRRNKNYGYMFEFDFDTWQTNSEYGYGFIDLTSNYDTEISRVTLWLDDSQFSDGIISYENMCDLRRDKGKYTIRGSFKDIDPEIVENWEFRDYRQVLTLFTNKDFNKDTAKEWEKHYKELSKEKDKEKKEYIENLEAINEAIAEREKEELAAESNVEASVETTPVVEDTISETTSETDTEEVATEEEVLPEEPVEINLEEIDKMFEEQLTEEMYAWFEEYLLSLADAEKGVESPLTTYLAKNPLPVYKDIKVVDKELYLCMADGTPWSPLSDESIEKYFDFYWNIYFSNVVETYVNENDKVPLDNLNDGVVYKLTKSVPFVVNITKNDEEEIVFWYKNFDGQEFEFYYPINFWMGEVEETFYEEYYNIPMDANVEYFAYYKLGEKYTISNKDTYQVETYTNDGMKVETKDFVVTDTIRYQKEDFYNEEATINVSDFVMNDGGYELPEGCYFLKNDTTFSILFRTRESEEEECSISNVMNPKDIFFLNRDGISKIYWTILTN